MVFEEVSSETQFWIVSCLATPDFGTCPEQISFDSQYFVHLPGCKFSTCGQSGPHWARSGHPQLGMNTFWIFFGIWNSLLTTILWQVTGSDFLGFTIDAYQRSTTLVLPSAKRGTYYSYQFLDVSPHPSHFKTHMASPSMYSPDPRFTGLIYHLWFVANFPE